MPEVLINVDVPDIRLAEAFYTKAFGLRVNRRLGDDAVELHGLGVALFLLEKPADSAPFAGAESIRSYARHWTPIHIDIVVEDIDAALARACSAGAVVEKPVVTTRWGKISLLADPFGHGFCLLQFLGRGYDEIAMASPSPSPSPP